MEKFKKFLKEKRQKYLPDDWFIFHGKEMQWWATLDFIQDLIGEFEIKNKRWFLINKDFDGYDITIRMWGCCKEDLELCLDDSLIMVDEEELFNILTELAS